MVVGGIVVDMSMTMGLLGGGSVWVRAVRARAGGCRGHLLVATHGGCEVYSSGRCKVSFHHPAITFPAKLNKVGLFPLPGWDGSCTSLNQSNSGRAFCTSITRCWKRYSDIDADNQVEGWSLSLSNVMEMMIMQQRNNSALQ